MSKPSAQNTDPRSVEQVSRERAMGEVADTLLCIEQAMDRAKRGLKTTAKSGGDVNVDLALNAALNDLKKTHKRLMQDTYYSGDALRLL